MYAPGPPLPSGMRPGFCFSGFPPFPLRLQLSHGAVTAGGAWRSVPRPVATAGCGPSSPDDVARRSRRWTATTPRGRPRAGPHRAGPVRARRRAVHRTVRPRRGPRARGRRRHGSAARQGGRSAGQHPQVAPASSPSTEPPSSSSSSMGRIRLGEQRVCSVDVRPFGPRSRIGHQFYVFRPTHHSVPPPKQCDPACEQPAVGWDSRAAPDAVNRRGAGSPRRGPGVTPGRGSATGRPLRVQPRRPRPRPPRRHESREFLFMGPPWAARPSSPVRHAPGSLVLLGDSPTISTSPPAQCPPSPPCSSGCALPGSRRGFTTRTWLTTSPIARLRRHARRS